MASKNLTFETAFKKLEQLVAELEEGGTSLEKSVEAFEEGMKLIEVCTAHLQKAELTIARLAKNADGTFTVEPADE